MPVGAAGLLGRADAGASTAILPKSEMKMRKSLKSTRSSTFRSARRSKAGLPMFVPKASTKTMKSLKSTLGSASGMMSPRISLPSASLIPSICFTSTTATTHCWPNAAAISPTTAGASLTKVFTTTLSAPE